MENYRGFGAPVMLFLHCSRIMGLPQWSDMGMWLQSVMLLLVEHGLASCPQECWAMYGQTVRETLGLGEDQILFTGLAIGHADDGQAVNQWPVPRVDLNEVIDWQGF
jgi:nitroreductase